MQIILAPLPFSFLRLDVWAAEMKLPTLLLPENGNEGGTPGHAPGGACLWVKMAVASLDVTNAPFLCLFVNPNLTVMLLRSRNHSSSVPP